MSQSSGRGVQDFKDTSHWVKFIAELYTHHALMAELNMIRTLIHCITLGVRNLMWADSTSEENIEVQSFFF